MLARRVSAEGRTRAYLGGRSATAADLRDAGAALLSFYGQHEHRKLMLASAQLEILDGFAGPSRPPGARPTGRLTRASGRWRAAGRAARARRGARPRAGPARVGAREIDRAAPSEEEEAALEAERGRLRHVEALRVARPPAASARWPAATRTAAAPRWRSPRRRRRSRPPAGWTPSSTRWRRASARSRSRPRTCVHELHRYAEGVEARTRAGWTRSRSGWRCWTASSASTAARSPRCSSTPTPAARAATSSSGAEEAIEDAEGELAALRAELTERAPASCSAAREAAGVGAGRAPCASASRALAMEGARVHRGAGAARRVRADRRRRGRVPDRARTRACRPARCARPPRAASSRG